MSIDVEANLEEKLGVYTILGACVTLLANDGLNAEPELGALFRSEDLPLATFIDPEVEMVEPTHANYESEGEFVEYMDLENPKKLDFAYRLAEALKDNMV